MGTYEITVVLHPDLEIDLEAPMSRVEEALTNVGATIKNRDEWGKRKLAYPIEGQTFGVYVFYVVDVEGNRIADIEHSLKLNEEVIRHLIVTYNENAEPEENTDESEGRKEEKPKTQPREDKTDTETTKESPNTSAQ